MSSDRTACFGVVFLDWSRGGAISVERTEVVGWLPLEFVVVGWVRAGGVHV
jgi:hypothetical protein